MGKVKIMKFLVRFNKVMIYKFIVNVLIYYFLLLGINLKRKKIVKLYCILLFILKGRMFGEGSKWSIEKYKKDFLKIN